MKKYETNELEAFEHPYELEYSSMKSSKNDSLKAQANKLKENNNNFLGINNINSQKNVLKNSQNLISINSFKSLPNDNNINFRLNEKTKKSLEKYIESKQAKKQNKKLKDKVKKQNININKIAHRKNHNNINIYSKINNYWESRDKKNKLKMQQIKQEREQKIYGELSQKPKISKNSKIIIERLKERSYELTEEDGYEDEINMNIPIRTREKNYFFKTVYYSNKNKLKNRNRTKINKSVSKINSYYEKNKLNKIQKSKKRAKTPKITRQKTNNKKSSRRKLNFSVADIKNLELIKQLRNKEQDKKMNEINEKIKVEENENSLDKKEKNENNSEFLNNNSYNMNKSMNVISMRNCNMNLMNDIMKSRRFLNDLYNRDKKIINHSFVLNSSSIPKTSTLNKIDKKIKNKSSSYNKNYKTINQKKNLSTRSENINKRNINKNFTGYGLYDPQSKSLKYRHFTEIPCSYNNINFNNENIKENQKKSNENLNKMIQSENNRVLEHNNNHINKEIKNNLYFKFDRDLNEKNEEINQIYKNELKYKTIEIKKIEIELNERNKINKQLIKESHTDDKDFQNIILKNQSINHQLNKMNNEYLLKFREENLKRLSEIRKKENKYDSNIYLKLKNEEEKNVDDLFNRKINAKKFKSIINNEQQNIENNLELYNNELKINQEKKKALLNKMFNNKYSKSLVLEDDKDDFDDSNVDKYLVKNDVIIKENFANKYFSKRTNDDLNEAENKDLVSNFEFQRRHHF